MPSRYQSDRYLFENNFSHKDRFCYLVALAIEHIDHLSCVFKESIIISFAHDAIHVSCMAAALGCMCSTGVSN